MCTPDIPGDNHIITTVNRKSLPPPRPHIPRMLYDLVEWNVGATSMLLVILGIAYIWNSNKGVGRRLPPGPRGLPLFGNILQVPSEVYPFVFVCVDDYFMSARSTWPHTFGD